MKNNFSNGFKNALLLVVVSLLLLTLSNAEAAELKRIKYNYPGLEVDLGVGLWAWPLPMDYDGDGDFDLVVSCHDHPSNGTYFFENITGNVKIPLFKPGVKIAPGFSNIQPSYVQNRMRLTLPARELVNFSRNGFKIKNKIYETDKIHPGKVRANQWKYCDYDGDGDPDLIVGVGDWTEYGWDNAFDKQGNWLNGPLHGYVYWIENRGGKYVEPKLITAAGKPVDVYGMPSPNFADFDNDGDLDLICGEFLDKFTYFQNIGSRNKPNYAEGVLLTDGQRTITMDLEMIVPVAFDWDRDGDVDLVVGQEDGRVALVENTGRTVQGIPLFLPPVFFRQQADEVKFGALVTPFSFDWDDDGDDDLICGNTAGYVGLIENLDGGNPPRWAEPKYLQADGKVIRIQAGKNGSIQGPCEAKWGYTTLSVADWDMDGLPDLVVNSIWGKVVWYRNAGTRKNPRLEPARPVTVAWPGVPPKPKWFWWQPEDKHLVTQWRTTPYVIDWNGDGLNDLIMLDQEGFLSFFERKRIKEKMELLPGRRIFLSVAPSTFDSRHRAKNTESGFLRLNNGEAGSSGRRKFCFVDWDRDGLLDLLVNSRNVNFLRNTGTNKQVVFRDMGEVDDIDLAGHSTSPTVVDWDKNGIPDLLVGAEDGYLYFMQNPYSGK